MTIMSKLLIVESPTKARTISKYLGKDFEVVATVGHLRDLPTNKMGVDLKSFEIDYVVDSKKKKVVDEIKKKAKKADEIYLASDPDREGEAISWHVKYLIDRNDAKRVSFHEITKDAIMEALANPREIDMDLVNAQQARRIFVSAVIDRDYPMIMGVTVVYGVIVVLCNLCVDLAYAWIDPRIKVGESS